MYYFLAWYTCFMPLATSSLALRHLTMTMIFLYLDWSLNCYVFAISFYFRSFPCICQIIIYTMLLQSFLVWVYFIIKANIIMIIRIKLKDNFLLTHQHNISAPSQRKNPLIYVSSFNYNIYHNYNVCNYIKTVMPSTHLRSHLSTISSLYHTFFSLSLT